MNWLRPTARLSIGWLWRTLRRLAHQDVIPFTPILATALVVAVFWRVRSDAPLVGLLNSPIIFLAWMTIGIVAPAMLLAAWLMITRMTGRWRTSGHFLRLSADLSMAFILSAYDFAHHAKNHPTSLATRLGIIAFVLILVSRDVWQIVDIVKEALRRRNQDAVAP